MQNIEDTLAGRIYGKIEPYVFRIKTAMNAEVPKASYGTGFVIDPKGLLITNFHVIAQALLNPQQNKLFLVKGQSTLPATILAVDIINDLALIQTQRTFDQALRIAKTSPKQGEALYSLGEPEDLNMAIVTGIFNGEIATGPYTTLHMSSPINSGMSGGPVLNKRGELVGVNVSKISESNNLSFAAPGRFVARLLQKATTQRSRSIIFEEIGEQLKFIQSELSKSILKSLQTKKIKMGKWQVSRPPDFLKCWSQKEKIKKGMGQLNAFNQTCSMTEGAYIHSDLTTGSFSLEFNSIETNIYKNIPFYNIINSYFKPGDRLNPKAMESEDSGISIVTPRRCFSEIISHKDTELEFKLVYCSRGYTHWKDLRDAEIALASLVPPPHGLTYSITMMGFTADNIRKILKATLHSISLQEE